MTSSSHCTRSTTRRAAELERVLKQRNALLRSAGGVLRGSMASTLDVWDDKIGQLWARQLLTRARPSWHRWKKKPTTAYLQLSGRRSARGSDAAGGLALRTQLAQARCWSALSEARAEDVRRGVTGVGPQRDELYMSVRGLAARTQASQGEQRSLALSLRLGGHSLVTDRQGSSPVLLLDDVFSELDPTAARPWRRACRTARRC